MLGVKTPALPASLRRTNQRTVISLLLRLGSASRADLAKAAGISQPTAGKITAELLRSGVVQQVSSSASENSGDAASGTPRLGRPGQMLRLDDQRPRFVAIELGVTETKVSALPVAVTLKDEWARTFATPSSPDAWLAKMRSAASELADRQLWGVLVSVPGIVDETAGRVIYSPNLHWLEKIDLTAALKRIWRLPTLLVQEIRALALGDLTAHPGSEDFFLADFGQGVGGAMVLDGKLYTNPMPLSGEFGHSPVAGNQRRCGCGASGCLVTLVSERGLLESFGASQGTVVEDWQTLVQHVSEKGIEPWLGDALAATAKVIAGALNVLGVHRVIITGLLTDLPGAVEQLASEIRKGALWARFGQVTCQSSPHRRAAGLVAVGIDRLVLPADEEKGLILQSAK
jgi:predicted NBD/HSP70 family sugar kinase